MDADSLKAIRKSLYRFCNHRDRTLQEVKKYIKKFSLTPLQEDSLIMELVESNLVDEYRFARNYARGKFRINGWGKTKIAHRLRQKGFGEGIIQIALNEIDDEEYLSVMAKHIWTKKKEINFKPGDEAGEVKIIRYLMSKGFECDLVKKALESKDER